MNFRARAGIRICDRWALDMCFQGMVCKIRRVGWLILAKRDFGTLIGKKVVMWPFRPVEGYSLWRIPCFDPLIGSQQNTWNSRKWQLTYLTYFCPSPWKLGRNPRNNTSFSDRTTVILGLSILISCGLLFILVDAIPWQVLSGFRPCIFCNWCALRSAWVFLGNWDGLNTTRWSIRLANLTWRLD